MLRFGTAEPSLYWKLTSSWKMKANSWNGLKVSFAELTWAEA